MGDSQSRQQLKCHICDDDWGSTSMAAMWGSIDSEEAISTIATLIKLPKTQKARRPRVAAMLALRRLLSHTPNAEHLNLTTSPFGQWCLQALRSSTRELRLAAGFVTLWPEKRIFANTKQTNFTGFLTRYFDPIGYPEEPYCSS